MTSSVLRMALGSASRGSWVSSLLAQRVHDASAAIVPRKSLTLTAAVNKRHYGPEAEHEKVDEVHHWTNERYVAIALVPIIPAALAFPHPVLDTALVSAMCLHTHWRLSGVVQDYIHGDVLPRIGRVAVIILSVCAFGSLCYFNYTDIGFARAVRLIYTQL